MTKGLRAQSLLLFLAPHQVEFFRILRFIPGGICSNKEQSTQKIKLFLILKDIQGMFFIRIHVHCPSSLD